MPTTMLTTSAASSSAQQFDTSPTPTEYPRDNLKHVVITATCFAFILSTLSVGFRVISRKISGKGLYLDDIFILGALVGIAVVIELIVHFNNQANRYWDIVV